MANEKLHHPSDEEIARAFAATHGFGALNVFHFAFENAGWIIRWYFDGDQQLHTMHVRVRESSVLEMRAPAVTVTALLELDSGGFMPYTAEARR